MVVIRSMLGPGRGERASHRPGDLDRAAGREHDDPHLRRELGGMRRRTRAPGRRCRGGRCGGRCPSGSAPPFRAAASRAPRPPRAGPCGRARSWGPSPRPGSAPRRAARQARPSPGTAPCRPQSRRRGDEAHGTGWPGRPAPAGRRGGRPDRSHPDARELDLVTRRRPSAPGARPAVPSPSPAAPAPAADRSRRRSERRSRWSWWPCEISTPSSRPTGRGAAPRGGRWATRARSTGSVTKRAPPSSSRTVAWPSQVRRVRSHAAAILPRAPPRRFTRRG